MPVPITTPSWMQNTWSRKPSPELTKLISGTRLSRSALYRILETWHPDVAVKRIIENPYMLIEKIYGIGFLIADAISVNAGIERNSNLRVQAGINHVLDTIVQQNGHTCLPVEELEIECRKLMQIDTSSSHDVVRKNINKMIADDEIIESNGVITSEKFYRMEKFISDKLKDILLNGKPKIQVKPISMKDLFDDQLQVVSEICKSNVFILTGPPGCGKSYTIKKIMDMYPDAKISFCAPTGKAAKRITEFIGKEALTIHKLLEPFLNKAKMKFEFSRTALNPLEADIIVIDETSMLSIELLNSLLKAVKLNTKLIFIGDTYQLPPVGAGYALRDMIQSRVIPTVEMSIIKRQDPGLIIQNCHRIKNGKMILIDPEVKVKDFYFFQETNMDIIQEKIVKFLTSAIQQRYPGTDILKDVQVISPLREKTDLSCKALNSLLQSSLNPSPVLSKCDFKIGDKVIQTKNNYRLGIINGDIGYIKSINPSYVRKNSFKIVTKTLTIDFENPDRIVKIPLYGKDNQLQLAYAITCHKFQGSENKIIIIPIHSSFGSLIMQRNWIYTAISRASKVCIVIGDKLEVSKIIGRNNQIKRFTNLQLFLTKQKGRSNGKM